MRLTFTDKFTTQLFNLITREGHTEVIFSKREAICQELLIQYELLVWQYRELPLIRNGA